MSYLNRKMDIIPMVTATDVDRGHDGHDSHDGHDGHDGDDVNTDDDEDGRLVRNNLLPL